MRMLTEADEKLLDRKCPQCGRFVSEENGYYMVKPPDLNLDRVGAELGLYCAEKCARAHRAEAGIPWEAGS